MLSGSLRINNRMAHEMKKECVNDVTSFRNYITINSGYIPKLTLRLKESFIIKQLFLNLLMFKVNN